MFTPKYSRSVHLRAAIKLRRGTLCENLRDEVRKGMREKAAQGIYPSRPPLGYRNNKLLRTIEVDPDNAPIAQRMFELYATGMYSLATLR